MERRSGLLMSREKGGAVFLTASGEFVRGRPVLGHAQIGDEVEFVPARANGVNWKTLGLVASLVMALLVSGSYYFTRPVIAAYVTVDFNPSIELGVDKNDVVRSAVALDDAAQSLLQSVTLVGKPVTQAVGEVMGQATQEGYFEAEEENLVVITTVSVNGEESVSPALAQLQETVTKAIGGETKTHVEAMPATSELRQEAQKHGISVGKLMMAQRAQEAGLHIDPDELKNNSIPQTIRSAGGDVGAILAKEPDQGRNAASVLEQKPDNSRPEAGSPQDDKKTGKKDNGQGNDKPKQNGAKTQDDNKEKQNGNGNQGNGKKK